MTGVAEDLAVVIPTLGRVRSVASLCERLSRQVPAPAVIAPTFQRYGELQEFRATSPSSLVVPVYTPVKGAGPARNAGVAALSDSIKRVAFLDDDVYPLTEHWLARLVAPLRGPHVLATTGPISGWTSHRKFALLPPWRANMVLPLVFHPVGHPEVSRTRTVGTLWGGNFATRRADFLAVGGFHPRFAAPSMFEETEFSIRLRRLRSGRLRYVPDAPVFHAQETAGGMRDSGSGFDSRFILQERLKLVGALRESDPWPFADLRANVARRLILRRSTGRKDGPQ